MANPKIFEILEDGLKRAHKAKHVFESPGRQEIVHQPFFTSLSLRDTESYSINVNNGGLVSRNFSSDHGSHGRVETRMGDYTAGGGMGSDGFILSKDFNIPASLFNLWNAANIAFWDCVDDFGSRNLSVIGSKNKREKYSYFSCEEPQIFEGNETKIELDLPVLEDILKQVSRNLLNEHTFNTNLDFQVVKENKYLLNSEGSRIFFSSIRYNLVLGLEGHDPENRIIPHSKVFYARNFGELPNYEQLMNYGEKLRSELSDLLKSPIQKNGAFPVIMDPVNHGVLWHEVIGHALEAHRMKDDDSEGMGSKTSIFAGKIGHKVAPGFISVEDDPTLENFDGYYPFDDEGVKAQKVCLIENGILKNYLHSRASAAYFDTKSNGHARSSNSNDPVARMSNLIVKSSNEVSIEQLKENLIKECERQKEPYGLMFFGSDGGLTMPEESHFETYPSRIFRLYRDGKMEQVRGIYVVGTPYHIMKNIIQTSNEYGLFRGVCGSESGWVPAVEKAPDALIKSLEINKIPDDSYQELKDSVVERPNFK